MFFSIDVHVEDPNCEGGRGERSSERMEAEASWITVFRRVR